MSEPNSVLQAGTAAPDFTLLATPERSITLSEIRVPVVLIFYPADFSPVCGDELSVFEAARALFDDLGARLLGISVDGAWCHAAYRADRNLQFPLLADFHPKGAVARAYGAFLDDDDTAARALFVVDAAGQITWSYLSPTDVSPGVDGALTAVESLS